MNFSLDIKFPHKAAAVVLALAWSCLQPLAAESEKPAHQAAIIKDKTLSSAHAPVPKLVDINSATNKELQEQLGVSEEVASKIVAGRPYGSKGWLVTNKVIDEAAFQAIKSRVVVKLTKADVKAITAKEGGKK